MAEPSLHQLYPASGAAKHRVLLAPMLVWSAMALMLALALLNVAVITRHIGRLRFDLADIAALALAAAALILAIRRARGRTRIADAFFPLVLLNPLLYSSRIHSPATLDRMLLAASILGLMTSAIIAMRRHNLFRYFAILALALLLAAIARSFVILFPPLAIFFLYAGYMLAQSKEPGERPRGFVIMALGEILLLFFGIACILEPAAAAELPSTPFQTIVGFTDFPLAVLAILMLALGWRKGQDAATPPHFAGMLALLVGMLALLLNNFQAGKLPPPGTNQTVLLLCLVYTVFALHGPRRLQWLVPPALLVLAGLYTFWG